MRFPPIDTHVERVLVGVTFGGIGALAGIWADVALAVTTVVGSGGAGRVTGTAGCAVRWFQWSSTKSAARPKASVAVRMASRMSRSL